jgi:hypothetical protein
MAKKVEQSQSHDSTLQSSAIVDVTAEWQQSPQR